MDSTEFLGCATRILFFTGKGGVGKTSLACSTAVALAGRGKRGFIETNTTGTSCLGPLAGLQAQKAIYDASLRALSEPDTTTLVLVSRPEQSALTEADRTRAELAEMGVTNQILFVNGVFVARDRNDPAAAALESRARRALAAVPAGSAGLSHVDVPLLPSAPMGIAQLRAVFIVAAAIAIEQVQMDARSVSSRHL